MSNADTSSQKGSLRWRTLALVGPLVALAIIVAGMVISVAFGAVLLLVFFTAGSALFMRLVLRTLRDESARMRSEPAVKQIQPKGHGVYFFQATAPHLVREGRDQTVESQMERSRNSVEEARRRLPESRSATRPDRGPRA